MTPRAMRRVYAREAAMKLSAARLAVRLLPAAWLFAWADRPLRRVCRFSAEEANWVAWAVDRAGARADAPCLPRALAAHAMLRRRGIASRLCLGVARSGDEVTAHAWIEVGQNKIVGGDEAKGFTPLAAFGGVK
jgi:hypothetical protein